MGGFELLVAPTMRRRGSPVRSAARAGSSITAANEAFSNGRKAMRSQYWLLTVMVGFTSLGLFLLASIKR